MNLCRQDNLPLDNQSKITRKDARPLEPVPNDLFFCVPISEGNLRNPALFTGNEPPAWEMTEQYLDLVQQYPCALSAVRAHLFRLWHHG